MLVKADILVSGIERDEAIAAEFLEKALAANGKDAELADLNGLRAGNEENVTVFITGHHAIAVNTDGKIRIGGHAVGIDGNFLILIARKINAGARRCGDIVKADLVDGRCFQRIFDIWRLRLEDGADGGRCFGKAGQRARSWKLQTIFCR